MSTFARFRPFLKPYLFRMMLAGLLVMTVAAIMAGLLPIMWSHGAGAEVMQRIAVPMIGGMVSSTILTLIVIPVVYAMVKGFRLRSAAALEGHARPLEEARAESP